MIEFGNSLKREREAKGYSVGQLAELTKLAPVTIEELEAEDFKHIAAPIYGRGFTKLYCQALGVDPKPFLDAFMAAFNGEKPQVQEQEPEVEPEPPPPPPATDPTPEPAGDFSRYATPLSSDSESSIPAYVWRLGILGGAAILILILIILGIRALYKATAPEEEASVEAAPSVETTVEQPAAPAKARVQQSIPALFID